MKIDGLLPGQAINLSDLAGILEKVSVGDMVRAQILEITSSDLMLKLFDGSTIRAKTSANIEGKAGDFLDLMVSSKEGNQLVLETVKNAGAKVISTENEVKSQLQEMGLKPDSKNTEILREMKSNQLPLKRDLFDQITDTIAKFKDLTPAKAAFLLSGNLKIEEKNINALNQLVDGKAKLAMQLDTLAKSLTGIGDENVIKEIETALKKVVSMPARPEGEQSIAAPSPKVEEEIPAQMQILVEEKPIPEKAVNLLKDSILQLESKAVKTSLPVQELSLQLSEFIKNNGMTDLNTEKFLTFLSQETGLLDKISLQDQSLLKDALDQVVTTLKNRMTKDPLEPEIQQLPANAPDQKKGNIEKAFHQLFVDIQSENLKDELNIKQLYKDLYGKLESLKEGIQQSTLPNRNEIVQQIDTMQNNMRFMNELSSHNSYVQIPLQIWDKNTTGELYVLKRDSKKKKIDPENVTVFLSLNTENLGQVDSLIGVNKKNITLNLRVEDPEIISFIKDNYKELYNRLQNKGFKLVDMKYRLIEEETNVLNVQEVTKKEISAGKVSIDYRL